MILNNLVFCIDENKKFVNGSIPSGKITANDINSNFLYVITPSPIKTLIKASFQNEMQNETPTTVALEYVVDKIRVDELVPKNAPYYNMVKDWNVFVSGTPAKALEMISYSRAGTIGVSFNFNELIIPQPPVGYNYIKDITNPDYVPNEVGYYVVKVAVYEFGGVEFTYNDILIKTSTVVNKRSALSIVKNTNTLRYSIDPSIQVQNFEALPKDIVDLILLSISDINQRVDDFILDGTPIDDETIVRNEDLQLEVAPELVLEINKVKDKVNTTDFDTFKTQNTQIINGLETNINQKVDTTDFNTFKTQNTQRINAVENGLQLQIDELEFVESIVLNGNDLDITYRNGNITKVPVNEAVESGYYDETTKELVLVLANGDEIKIPVDDIVAGLASISYVDGGLATKENTSNKISSVSGVLNNKQYMGAKLTNDLIIAVKNDLEAQLLTKQEELVSGVNIKTVGMQSLLGSGNISIPSTEEFASKQELASYISSKNLAVPDLKGKEYLGEGWYMLYNANGITFDYNVFSGIYSLVGTPTTNIFELIRPELVGNQTYTLSAYKISGTTNDVLFSWYHGQDLAISFPYQTTQTKTLPNYNAQLYALKDSVYNIQFKFQLEKGDTATPYAVPSGVIPYLPEVKKEFDSKLDKITATSALNQVYVKAANGLQDMMNIADLPHALTIACRGLNGELAVGNAVGENDAVALGQLNWTLIATNNSTENDVVSLPAGTREVLITANNGSNSIILPNINNAKSPSFLFAGVSGFKVMATWNILSGDRLQKTWGVGSDASSTTYSIYGR